MKILLLFLFSVIFLTDAVEVTDEDINSPLVSYLLAKVQRLEARIMARPNVRNTREVEKRSVDTNTSADDKKIKDCPQQVVTYIRWGNKTCPYGANTIYQGVALGGHYSNKGSASNMMCSPRNAIFYPKRQNGGSVTAYGVEYRVSGFHNHANCRDMPCALCEATGRGDKIMIPSQNLCPNGWHKEYNGYIMAGADGHEGGSMYYCIDEVMEQIQSSGSCDGAHYLYTVHSYVLNNSGASELPCVVCTK